MAKETSKAADGQIEVHFRNDWFSGARLLRSVNNPHFLPEAALGALPESAQVMKDGELVSVKELRTSAPVDAKKTELKV